MRIAIISDIHSNIEALTEVLRVAEEQRVDRIVSLGDTVGYGASPNPCCDLVRSVAEVTLLGNHDAAVAGRMDYSFYYDAARHALDWSASVLSDENLAWLRSLPYTYRLGDVGFCHGSPVEPQAYEYIFALEQARELTAHVADLPEVTFIGHSHLCKAFAIGNGEVNDVVAQKFGIRRGYKYLISVGSVGQPRDYDNRACFVICDTGARTVEYLRVEYDIDAAAQKIYDADLALNFGKRLYLGV
ncbi:metallophosphoesterase family protein [Aggregicoccus sp. 17bor-14]|uniref:metallophosphoesterase family protein n=1 Tax=Myxococcaceae TaxID=31 RepID=UPI00129C4BE6|nr:MULTISPECIES: metallophosphoesterase family protein [Myxococcaceae]MBF5040841.1 metallophosphoesterase family protein [Simulacricoccus sp. 17bor-14]MRI86630.1 metallophosphoesterase family protein [Aggregicoccus sp. 17bor-14]